MSIAHRFTGASLSGGFYAALIGYGLFGPKGGAANLAMHNKVLEAIRSTPTPVVIAGKLAISTPMAYHCCNGVRHLIWDLGYGLSLKAVYRGGWAVNIATAICAGYFSFVK